MKLNNFNAIYSNAKMLYDINLDKSDFEDIGLIAWEKIGNRYCKVHRYTTDTINKEIDLPCNVDEIISVTLNREDSKMTQPWNNFNYIESLIIESYIEKWKHDKHPLYTSGKYVRFIEEDNKLVFSRDYNNVTITYRGIILDEDELPLVTEREIQAISLYLSYIEINKKALITKDPSYFQLAQAQKLEWGRACLNARIKDKLTWNDMDEVLDAKYRSDRKIYRRSYKPVL